MDFLPIFLPSSRCRTTCTSRAASSACLDVDCGPCFCRSLSMVEISTFVRLKGLIALTCWLWPCWSQLRLLINKKWVQREKVTLLTWNELGQDSEASDPLLNIVPILLAIFAGQLIKFDLLPVELLGPKSLLVFLVKLKCNIKKLNFL